MGRVLFRDAAGDMREVDTDDPAGRDAYRTEWQNRRAALQSMCNRLGVILVGVRTDEDVRHAMTFGLRHHAAGRR
jgi:uncharacterized protein (DUF58 family)